MSAELGVYLEKCIIRLCITDTEFLKLSRNTLPVEYYSTKFISEIAGLCYQYYDLVKSAPKVHIADEVLRHTADMRPELASMYTRYLDIVCSDDVRPDKAYVISRLSAYARKRNIHRAIHKAADHIEKNNTDEAEKVLSVALRTGVAEVEGGINYSPDTTDLRTRGLGKEYLMPTGIPHFDVMIGGWQRRQFLCFMGGPKGKKSWALLHLAKTAMMHGLKVVYVTHELDAEQVERRLDMMVCALPTRPIVEERIIPAGFDHARGVNMPEGSVRYEDQKTIYDTEYVSDQRRRFLRFGGRLRIRKYPMGACTMGELERYLEYLDGVEEYHADVVLNDYADIMSFPQRDSDLRQGLNEIYIRHKKLADERNILVVTASQVNRANVSRTKIGISAVAEDIRKIANVDYAIAITPVTDDSASVIDQGRQHISRLQVVAGREEGMGARCRIFSHIPTGQFCITSRDDMDTA